VKLQILYFKRSWYAQTRLRTVSIQWWSPLPSAVAYHVKEADLALCDGDSKRATADHSFAAVGQEAGLTWTPGSPTHWLEHPSKTTSEALPCARHTQAQSRWQTWTYCEGSSPGWPTTVRCCLRTFAPSHTQLNDPSVYGLQCCRLDGGCLSTDHRHGRFLPHRYLWEHPVNGVLHCGHSLH